MAVIHSNAVAAVEYQFAGSHSRCENDRVPKGEQLFERAPVAGFLPSVFVIFSRPRLALFLSTAPSGNAAGIQQSR